MSSMGPGQWSEHQAGQLGHMLNIGELVPVGKVKREDINTMHVINIPGSSIGTTPWMFNLTAE